MLFCAFDRGVSLRRCPFLLPNLHPHHPGFFTFTQEDYAIYKSLYRMKRFSQSNRKLVCSLLYIILWELDCYRLG